MTAEQRTHMKRRMNGKCVDCGREAYGSRCNECRTKVNERFQKRYLLTRLREVTASGLLTRQEILQAISRPNYTSDQQV